MATFWLDGNVVTSASGLRVDYALSKAERAAGMAACLRGDDGLAIWFTAAEAEEIAAQLLNAPGRAVLATRGEG